MAVSSKFILQQGPLLGALAKTAAAAAMLAAPPGLSQPLSASRCPVCHFDITTPGAQCLCDWD